MAREGLRVLVVSKKSLTEEQYQDFEVSALSSGRSPGIWDRVEGYILQGYQAVFMKYSLTPLSPAESISSLEDSLAFDCLVKPLWLELCFSTCNAISGLCPNSAENLPCSKMCRKIKCFFLHIFSAFLNVKVRCSVIGFTPCTPPSHAHTHTPQLLDPHTHIASHCWGRARQRLPCSPQSQGHYWSVWLCEPSWAELNWWAAVTHPLSHTQSLCSCMTHTQIVFALSHSKIALELERWRWALTDWSRLWCVSSFLKHATFYVLHPSNYQKHNTEGLVCLTQCQIRAFIHVVLSVMFVLCLLLRKLLSKCNITVLCIIGIFRWKNKSKH